MTGHLIPLNAHRFWSCLGWWWADFRCAYWRLGKTDNLTPGQHAFIHAKLTLNQRRQMRNILASGEGPTL